jgi:hypothetical protein
LADTGSSPDHVSDAIASGAERDRLARIVTGDKRRGIPWILDFVGEI